MWFSKKNLDTVICMRKNGCWAVKNHRDPLEVPRSVGAVGDRGRPRGTIPFRGDGTSVQRLPT